jgi:hypothetical protein
MPIWFETLRLQPDRSEVNFWIACATMLGAGFECIGRTSLAENSHGHPGNANRALQ